MSFWVIARPRRDVRRKLRPSAFAASEALEVRQLLAAVTIQMSPVKDNTIYSVAAGDVSNGVGDYLIVGGASGEISARRGLLAFDVEAAEIPLGSTILDVTLRLHLSNTVGGPASVSLHQVLRVWGEGLSESSGNEFDGAPATPFDATWLFSQFDGTVWSTPGGDFAGSSSTISTDLTGYYEWSGGGLIADVQDWLDNPGSNFGWLLKSPEASGNIKAFASKDADNAALTPILEVTYEEAITTGMVEGRKFHDRNGDGLREVPAITSLGLQFRNGRDFFNAYGGQEYWYYSPGTNSWFILTPDGRLTRWDGRAGKLTGVVVQQLDPRHWQQPGSLLAANSVGGESWLNGFVIELVNAQGTVVATTITRDLDLNNDGIIQEEAERGWFQFPGLNSGGYFVREAITPGWTESASGTSRRSEAARALDEQLQLFVSNGLHENFGGLGERWLRGSGNVWYYITPVGEFFRWNGRAISQQAPLTGTLLASLGAAYYRDVSLLHAAPDPEVRLNSNVQAGRRDLGGFQPVSISGRTWNDINPDGLRNHPQFSTAVGTQPPVDAPAGTSGLPWFTALVPESEVRSGGSFTTLIQTFLYVESGGRITQWTPGEAARLRTTVSAIAGNSTSAVIAAGLVAEPWTNGVVVQLLDDGGRIVASTTSADEDLDGNGLLEEERERGVYRFGDLLPGRYTVRMVSPPGSLASSHPSAGLQNTSAQLQELHGFRNATQDHFNFGHRNERWFLNRNNDWFFITPAGEVFEWDKNSGGIRGPARGRLVAQLSSSEFLNLNLLFRPVTTSVTLFSQQSAGQLSLGSCRVLDSVFASLAGELQP